MVSKIKGYGKRTFSSLSVRNYRLYFIGQAISLSGNWLQTIAQTWLVFELTHSGTQIGLLTATQFLPILLLGPVGGLVADRLPKRRILFTTQTAAMLLALTLAILVLSHQVQVWMVFALALGLGLVNVIDNPTRQTFVLEMVGRERLTNAVTLNSIEVNMTRVIGPAIAGGLIAGVGVGYCFLVNAVSYLAVLLCLGLMNARELHVSERAARAKGQLREGFAYVWRTPVLRNVLLMMALVGTLSYEFQVILPVFAAHTFHSDAGGYSLLMVAMGFGAVIGGILVASRRDIAPGTLLVAAFSFGISILLTAAAPTLTLAAICMVLIGISSISFTAITNSTLQLQTAPEMRGRVMSLWTMAFLGSTPIGGPIIGWISEHFSPRYGLLVGGLAAILAGLMGLGIRHRARRHSEQVATAPALINKM